MTILVGYSPSPEGKAAVEFGIEQARAFDDVLVVLNAGIGETPDERGVATSKDIEELKETLKSSEVSHEILQFLRGNDPVEELLALAEATTDTRMIVIGSRRRSPSASSSWVRRPSASFSTPRFPSSPSRSTGARRSSRAPVRWNENAPHCRQCGAISMGSLLGSAFSRARSRSADRLQSSARTGASHASRSDSLQSP